MFMTYVNNKKSGKAHLPEKMLLKANHSKRTMNHE